jgi:carbonic anhydrase/acetyltransferase-like protein (isoleucine patch superfamily)
MAASGERQQLFAIRDTLYAISHLLFASFPQGCSMRKIIVRKPNHVAPFNEPARALRVLNKPLWQWQQDLLAPYVNEQIIVDDPRNGPRDNVETLIHAENLWFDEAFLSYFIRQARLKGRPARAALQADEPPFMQHGLKALSKSYTQRADYYYLDLWYFPNGVTDQVEALTVPSDVRSVSFHHIPVPTSGKGHRKETYWSVPARAVVPVDSWVHVLLINVIMGLGGQIEAFNQAALQGNFKSRARWRSFVERKPAEQTSMYVHVGRDCKIDPTAVIQGPVWIGDHVTIGPGCVITNSIIGDNVTMLHSNHFDRCVIGDDCFFPWGAGAYMSIYMEGSSSGQSSAIEMSVIGRNTFIGAGTILTDYNLLPLPLKTVSDGHLAELGLPMLGGCVGHNCRIGSGLVMYPGRTVESDVVLMASSTRRVIAKNISYEESDHHYIHTGDLHQRRYTRVEDPSAYQDG